MKNDIRNKILALNSKTRIKILLSCKKKALSITELSKKLNMSHGNTSQNVSMLEKENLVSKTRHKNNTVTVKSLIKISKNKIEW